MSHDDRKEPTMYDQTIDASHYTVDQDVEPIMIWRGHIVGPGVGRVVYVRTRGADAAAMAIWDWWMCQPQEAQTEETVADLAPTVVYDVRPAG